MPARVAALLVAVGLLADVAGVWGEVPRLWETGYFMALVAAAAAALAGISALSGAPRRPGVAAVRLGAAGVLGLAVWIRGHFGVPPDPPILGLQALAAAVLLARGRRARTGARSRDGRGDG